LQFKFYVRIISKRLLDLFGSSIGLILTFPLLIFAMIAVWLYDFKSPLYSAVRIGKNKVGFKMYKIRSMSVDKTKSHIVSTSINDSRITPVGKYIRKFKIDELSQLLNVFIGNMSLVGPRPNVQSEVRLYTKEEEKILLVKPGITDFSSIVFSDLNELLSQSDNPNLDYNQLVRPWKSRLCIFYIKNQSLLIDLQLIGLTIISIFNRKASLNLVQSILFKKDADSSLIKISGRTSKLVPFPPPGSNDIVHQR